MLRHGHKKTGDENHQILNSCVILINVIYLKQSPSSGIHAPGIRRAEGAGVAADFASAKIHLEG